MGYSPSGGESSHKKSPKSPLGEISPNQGNESCRASNSKWKTGITSLIAITQLKMTALEKSLILAILATFEVFGDLFEPDRFFKGKVQIKPNKGPICQRFISKNGNELENPTHKVPFLLNFKGLYSKLSLLLLSTE